MKPEQILSFEEEQRMRALLAAAADSDGLTTPARVEQALRGELRRRARRGLAVRVAAAGTLAAAVLVGLALNRPPASVPAEPAVPVPLVAAESPRPAALTPMPAGRAALRAEARPRPRARRRLEPPTVEQQGETSEFIPVGTWQALEPMERGSIIRVRLPKSSLPGFGIPVSADRWNESIPADVVLGEDGSMRAVRFVTTSQ